MKIDNMRELVERLKVRKNPLKFDMGSFFKHGEDDHEDKDSAYVLDIMENHSCGTVACIAGHAAIAAWGKGEYLERDIFDTARLWLGLNHKQAFDLFYDNWSGKNMTRVSKRETIAHLKALIERGSSW